MAVTDFTILREFILQEYIIHYNVNKIKEFFNERNRYSRNGQLYP